MNKVKEKDCLCGELPHSVILLYVGKYASTKYSGVINLHSKGSCQFESYFLCNSFIYIISVIKADKRLDFVQGPPGFGFGRHLNQLNWLLLMQRSSGSTLSSLRMSMVSMYRGNSFPQCCLYS